MSEVSNMRKFIKQSSDGKNFTSLKSLMLSLLVSYVMFGCQVTKAQRIPTNKELLKIRNEIQQLVNNKKIPSMAIGVVKDGKVIWQEAIGYSDIEKKEKATIKSIYPLGSVSKSITASGVMTLVNSNRLKLTQDINTLIVPVKLKDINGKSPKINLWQLISMNGGLNHAYGVFYDASKVPQTLEEKKKFFEETTIIAFKPGNVYEYSNNSFYIAEYLIESLTKKEFQAFMEKNLFNPLLMTNTYSSFYEHKKSGAFVSTYTNQLKKINRNIDYPSGGSGFWSSLEDMTKFAMFHSGNIKNKELIDKQNLDLMHNFRQGAGDLYGLGWFNLNGLLVSNGNVNGGNANITIDKENQLAVICLLNKTSWNGLADQYAGKIRNVFVKEKRDGFAEWRRIYGTPYKPKYELKGKWKGHIKQPVTNKIVKMEINFTQNGKIELTINNQTLDISNPTYNLFKELEGSFKAKLGGIYPKETRCGMKLKHKDNKLLGYIQYDNFSDERFYRMPLYVELKRQ